MLFGVIMVMDQLGKRVSEYPKATIVTIIVITLLALGSIVFFGIDQEFSEEAFLPDMEISRASNEITDEYTATSSVSILVKSKSGDLLTSTGLVEILQIENKLVNDSKIVRALENPALPSANVNSVADIIAQMALVQQNVTFPNMDQKIFIIQNMNDNDIKQLVIGIFSSNQTLQQIKGMFSFMLTKEFNPTTGNIQDIKAKGTMIIISMNSSMAFSLGHTTEESPLSIAEGRMDEIVKNSKLESTEMRVLAQSIIMEEIMDANTESMIILLPMAFGMVVVILAIIYRSGLDMLFSLLALAFAIIWVYGFGAALGYTFNPITTAVPILIVGLGIDYGIHITMRYREEVKAGKKINQSIILTIASVGMALLLATITTVIAFLSNMASPITLLGEFGVLAAIGIIGSFITMTTFVPAIKQIRDSRRFKKYGSLNKKDKGNTNKPHKKGRNTKSAGVVILDKAMSSGALAAEHHPAAVIIVVLLITLGAGWLTMQLDTTFNFEDFLPEDLDISKDIEFMINEFEVPGGEAEQVNILVKGDITDPGLLSELHETIDNMADDDSVVLIQGKADVESILSFMTDWATNATAIDPYDNDDKTFEDMYNNTMASTGAPRIGAKKEDIKQLYNWLCMNPRSSKDVKRLLHRTSDNEFDGTVLRISVVVDMDDNAGIDKLHSDLKEDKKPLDGVSDKSIVTSGPILTKVIMDLLNESQIRSLVITIIVSLIVLTIVFWFKWRSLILGLITITPVIFCVIWTLGTMYLVDIPLNVMTITIASLTVGLGITYGIHITHRFLEDIERHDSIDAACRSTVTHTGTALFGAAATTIAGFGLLVFALLPPLQQFGGITALTILFSFLASVFILPTFLTLWARWRRKHGKLENNKKGKAGSDKIEAQELSEGEPEEAFTSEKEEPPEKLKTTTDDGKKALGKTGKKKKK
jgi:predicted RND superfamily exporter protein